MSDLNRLLAGCRAEPQRPELWRKYAYALELRGLVVPAKNARAAALFIEGGCLLSSLQERALRRMAGARRRPVKVIDGDKPPTAEGEEPYSTFKDGGRCKHPGSAMRAGYKVRYVPSTLRVEVGRKWLIKFIAGVRA